MRTRFIGILRSLSRGPRNVTEQILMGAASSDQSVPAIIDQNFGWRRMAEKRERARRSAIGARLEDADEVPYTRLWQPNVSAEGVERRTQRPHDVDDLRRGSIEPVHDADREVALDDLSQISRCREVVVHAAV